MLGIKMNVPYFQYIIFISFLCYFPEIKTALTRSHTVPATRESLPEMSSLPVKEQKPELAENGAVIPHSPSKKSQDEESKLLPFPPEIQALIKAYYISPQEFIPALYPPIPSLTTVTFNWTDGIGIQNQILQGTTEREFTNALFIPDGTIVTGDWVGYITTSRHGNLRIILNIQNESWTINDNKASMRHNDKDVIMLNCNEKIKLNIHPINSDATTPYHHLIDELSRTCNFEQLVKLSHLLTDLARQKKNNQTPLIISLPYKELYHKLSKRIQQNIQSFFNSTIREEASETATLT